MSEKTLRICHLYPDLLNLYGDRGNILCMRRRLEWRGIDAEVTEVTVGQQADFTQFDLFFIGGGQDFEQEVLLSDLKAGKGSEIKAAIADGKTFLTICGGYQMLGSYYRTWDGKQCDFIGAIDYYTVGARTALRACAIKTSSARTATARCCRKIRHFATTCSRRRCVDAIRSWSCSRSTTRPSVLHTTPWCSG